MKDLRRTTLTTLEVAEMMEVEHSKIIRKLEGSKDRKGYIDILGEAHLGVTDYFVKSTYLTEQNKEMPCYEVTRLGCDFLANKSTGEKGILFTARYVKRFYEMEHQIKQVALTEHPGEVANLIKVMSHLMDKQGSAPYKVAENAQLLCQQYGINLISDFVRLPACEQLQLASFITGVQA